MDFADRRTVQQLLKKYGVSPKRHLGQNFLVSPDILRRIVAAADIKPDETILEIGGGLGTLTLALAQRAKRVIVYEREAGLCRALDDLSRTSENIEVRCADARGIRDADLPSQPYRLIANLPYGVGTVVLRTLLEYPHAPKGALVMLQRDVAERICGKPPRLGILGIAIQSLAEPQILFRIPPRATWPAPKVESACVRFALRRPRMAPKLYRALVALARTGFAHPRKKLAGNLAQMFAKEAIAKTLHRCRIGEQARAQELSLAQWHCLTRHLPRV